MTTCRCTKCNSLHRFRATKGAKLSDKVCDCGGSLTALIFVNLGGFDFVYMDRKNVVYELDIDTNKFHEKAITRREA